MVENNLLPTCEKSGSYDNVVRCTVCNAELSRETVIVDAVGHDYKELVTAPTCTEQGFTTYICSVCEHSHVDNYVSALGHTYGDWVIIKEPTESESGEKRKTCECGDFISEEIPVLSSGGDDDSSIDSSNSESSDNFNSSSYEEPVQKGCFGSLNSNMASVLMILPVISIAWIITKKRK